MAVQQRRVSKSRKGMRKSHLGLKETTTTKCRKCGRPIKPHHVCKYCGYYDNKKIVDIKK